MSLSHRASDRRKTYMIWRHPQTPRTTHPRAPCPAYIHTHYRYARAKKNTKPYRMCNDFCVLRPSPRTIDWFTVCSRIVSLVGGGGGGGGWLQFPSGGCCCCTTVRLEDRWPDLGAATVSRLSRLRERWSTSTCWWGTRRKRKTAAAADAFGVYRYRFVNCFRELLPALSPADPYSIASHSPALPWSMECRIPCTPATFVRLLILYDPVFLSLSLSLSLSLCLPFAGHLRHHLCRFNVGFNVSVVCRGFKLNGRLRTVNKTKLTNPPLFAVADCMRNLSSQWWSCCPILTRPIGTLTLLSLTRARSWRSHHTCVPCCPIRWVSQKEWELLHSTVSGGQSGTIVATQPIWMI